MCYALTGIARATEQTRRNKDIRRDNDSCRPLHHAALKNVWP